MKSTSVWRHFDLWLTAAVLLLTAYGILVIRSAVTGAPAFEDFPQRQVIFAFIGIAVMLAIAAVDYRILTSSHWYIYIFIVISLIFVYLVGVNSGSGPVQAGYRAEILEPSDVKPCVLQGLQHDVLWIDFAPQMFGEKTGGGEQPTLPCERA